MTTPANTSTTTMDINIHASFLPQTDPDASLAFYRDTLGFEVRKDVGYNGLRWITVGPAGQPGTSIVLYPPVASPGVTEDEKRTIAEMMAKGTYAIMLLATKDLDAAFERIQASGAEIVEEPTDQPTAFVIAPCAIPQATCCACNRCVEPSADRIAERDAIEEGEGNCR